jgi:flagellar motor switch protein FliN
VTITETNITADHEATRLIETQTWLLKEFATGLAAAFEGITGERAQVTTTATNGPPGDPRLPWRQPLLRLPGAMWIVADETSWRAIGASVLRATEIEETPDQLRSEYLEVIRQAVSRVASAMTSRLDVEILPAGGEQTDPVRELAWGAIEVKLADSVATIAVAFEAEMLFALTAPVSHELPRTESVSAKLPKDSKTYDLLLDLELPVSISFGRANVPLKDVLKFTVGSIVELNRAIGDPVEVIVNNCVIARGQVVVVEGNFGVRILNVISTQERLRSLD